MNINIYYGGRGVIEDPTLSVLKKIESVLDELRVNVTRYNLYDMKNSIMTLPQTLKDADGIILAASVEWNGIGGYLQLFLDACWLYGDKSKISQIYMTPVVISTTYGEKEGLLSLTNAWELLGGKICQGFSAYVEDYIDFESNVSYGSYIEKRAENIYRTISQHIMTLPSSSLAIKQNLIHTSLELTPQEGEQLSKYVSDDIYVQKQKEDIEELASYFKGILGEDGFDSETEFIKPFKSQFVPQDNFSASYMLIIEDKKKTLYIKVENKDLYIKYEKNSSADIVAKLSHECLDNIIRGRMTFQRAFMTGEMTAKGNFKTLRMLDQVFAFNQS
ncbi:MAG: SCP2 sterol-binding domain-containing protein [Lachnospiraceae bacterium]